MEEKEEEEEKEEMEEKEEVEKEEEEFHKGTSRLRGTRARPQVSHCPHQLDFAMILLDTEFAFLIQTCDINLPFH